MTSPSLIHGLTQFALPLLTILAQAAIATKHPEIGLFLNLSAQPFWIYSGWQAYRGAGQIGILITAILFTLITIFGVINYSFL